MRVNIIYVLLFITVAACRKDEVKLRNDDSSIYVPLAIDYEWVYHVDSIVYYGDAGRAIDTFSYQIMRTVEDTFTNAEQHSVFVVYQYCRPDSSAEWKYQFTYTEVLNDDYLLKTKDDVSEIILSFPISTSKEWDSNIFNTREQSESYYENIHKSNVIAGVNYDSTVAVKREYAIFFTKSQFVRETYAAQIGLIQAEVEDLTRLENLNPREYYGSTYTLHLSSFEK